MSLPDNYVTVSHHNISQNQEDKRAQSLPVSGRDNDIRKDRSVEDFLNRMVYNNSENPQGYVSNESITIKDMESHHSSVLSEIQVENISDHEDHIAKSETPKISNSNDLSDEIKTHSLSLNDSQNNLDNQINSTDSNLIAERLNDKIDNSLKSSTPIPNGDSPETNDFSTGNRDKVATPTIKFTKQKKNPENSKENESHHSAQGHSNYEDFSKKLNHLSNLLEQKDEEIQKLSEQLKELKSKKKSRKKSSSSSSSVSSDETHKSSKKKSKSKTEKEKKEKKPKDKKEKKKEKEEENVMEISIPKTEETIEEKPDIPDHQDKVEKEDKTMNHCPSLEDCSKGKSLSTEEISLSKEKLTSELRKKLEELESEVRRLQQANVDSILTLQKLKENKTIDHNVSNETVINQLLVDYNLLKEELQQLKWDYGKVTNTGVIIDQINQLKEDMGFLRKQNEFLKNFTKQSSRSTGHLSSQSYHVRDSKDYPFVRPKDRHLFISDIPDTNNNSTIPFSKHQGNRRSDSESTNVQKMLKKNIESLESPYHATCQSIHHSVPFSGGPTYRARKVSDSSSILIEDVKPKSWMEPITKNYSSTYHQFSNNYPYQYDYPNQRDFDDQSVSSYVSVTTSVTEKSDDEWRPRIENHSEMKGDLFSTQNSDLTESTLNDEESCAMMPKVEYSFTPKKPTDLSLEDIVKFVRPGGKMSMGRVCFIGHLPGRNEICVGLELGEDAGKHDGLFEGVRYFQCRKNRGVFISFHKIILAYKSV